LVNSRTDVALAVGADGVHLRSDDVSPEDVRRIWEECGAGTTACDYWSRTPVIGVSCHSPQHVAQAAENHATFAVFAPLFEKKDDPGVQPAGIVKLREACKSKIPVLALGGVKLENAADCLDAGAAGVAAIRLFQENPVGEIVRRLGHL